MTTTEVVKRLADLYCDMAALNGELQSIRDAANHDVEHAWSATADVLAGVSQDLYSATHRLRKLVYFVLDNSDPQAAKTLHEREQGAWSVYRGLTEIDDRLPGGVR